MVLGSTECSLWIRGLQVQKMAEQILWVPYQIVEGRDTMSFPVVGGRPQHIRLDPGLLWRVVDNENSYPSATVGKFFLQLDREVEKFIKICSTASEVYFSCNVFLKEHNFDDLDVGFSLEPRHVATLCRISATVDINISGLYE